MECSKDKISPLSIVHQQLHKNNLNQKTKNTMQFANILFKAASLIAVLAVGATAAPGNSPSVRNISNHH